MGSKNVNRRPTILIPRRIRKTILPPARWLWRETENREDATLGAMARVIQPTACAIPLMAPREARFGVLSRSNTNIDAK